jgi:hypothetical protein
MYIKFSSRRIYGLLFFLIILCNSVYSQGYISWKLSDKIGVQRISVETGENIVFYENHIDTLPKYTLNYDAQNYEITLKGHLFKTSSGLKAVFPGTGKVFLVDTAAGIIERIDETYYSGYNFDSYQFIRNDTIYSFGGYGFWIQNNLLTYYSDVRKEWSLFGKAPFALESPDLQGPQAQISFYDRLNDILYVVYQDEAYSYSFISRSWKDLGQSSFGFNNQRGYMVHTVSDSTCLLMSSLKTYWWYPGGNSIADITLENGGNLTNRLNVLGLACAYSENDKLTVPKHSDKLKLGYYFESLKLRTPPIESIKPAFIRRVNDYQNLLFVSFGLFTLFGILLTAYLRMGYLNKRAAIFDSLQWEVLERSVGGPITTDDFNDLLGVNEASWEVQRRKRSEFIKELNATSKKQLGAEVLLREKSELDKRQILYVLNPRLENDLARLL